MSTTTFRLLMRDGAVTATFAPVLTPEQYGDLYERVANPSTKAELRRVIESAAREWGVRVAVDLEPVSDAAAVFHLLKAVS